MSEQTTVESGPLVMDALSIARAMSQPSEVKTPTTPLPESTTTETPVAPVTTETQEPVAPAAGETKPETAVGEPAKPETSTATETKPAELKRDWRVDAYYKAIKDLEELKAKPAATTPEPAKPVTAATVEDVEPVWDPEKYPNGYDDFIRALATHHGVKAAKDLAKTSRVTEEQNQVAQHFQQRDAKFKQAIVDSGIAISEYYETMAKAPIKFTQRAEDFLGECVDSPVGPKILHFLAQNPEEVVRIDGLGKRAQFREFEALENRFKSAPTGAPATTPAPAVPILNPGVSKAPAPIPTLATGVTKPPRKSEAELAVLSPEEWQAAHPDIVVHRGRHARR